MNTLAKRENLYVVDGLFNSTGKYLNNKQFGIFSDLNNYDIYKM